MQRTQTSIIDSGRAPVRVWWILQRVILGLLLMALAWTIVTFAVRSWTALAYPYQLDYGEGPLLDQALRLAHGESIYRSNLAEPPFTLSNYPPLYVLVQVPFAAIFGPALWYGRLISLAGLVGTTVCMALTLYRLTHDRLAALLAGGLFLAIPYVLHWGPLARVDGLALGLSWAGLWLLVARGDRRGGVISAALLLVAAVYTRQSYAVAAPLAATIWLLRQYSWRRAAWFVGLVALFSGAALLILQIITQGGFWTHIVGGNLNEFHIGTIQFLFAEIWDWMSLLVVAGVTYFALAWRRGDSWWLVAPYLVGAAISAITVGKVGSNVNYVLELMAALSLAAGALLAWLRSRPALRSVGLALAALQLLILSQWFTQIYVRQRALAPAPENERLLAMIRRADGPVLTDDYMALVPLTGKRIQFQAFEMTQLARAGRWDQQPMLDLIERGAYASILINQPASINIGWTPEMLAAIERHYEPVEMIGTVQIYRPRS